MLLSSGGLLLFKYTTGDWKCTYFSAFSAELAARSLLVSDDSRQACSRDARTLKSLPASEKTH